MIHPIVSPSLPDTSDSETLMSLVGPPMWGRKNRPHVTGILNLVTGVMVQTAFALLKELS